MLRTKVTALARQLPGTESDHGTCSRRLRKLPRPATPDSWRDPPSQQLEANPHTLVTELAESGAGDEVIMNIAGHVSRHTLALLSYADGGNAAGP